MTDHVSVSLALHTPIGQQAPRGSGTVPAGLLGSEQLSHPQVSSGAPANTTQYLVHVLDPNTQADVVAVTQVGVTGEAVQTVTLNNVPVGPALIEVDACDAAGTVLERVTQNLQLSEGSTVDADITFNLQVSPTTALLAQGGTEQLAVTLTPPDQASSDVTAACTYTSSNPAVATVSASGLVTATGPGSVTIAAQSGNQTVSTALKVSHTRLLWHLNEAAGTTVSDASGHGYSGTITGSPGFQASGPNGNGTSTTPGTYALTLPGRSYVQVDDPSFASFPYTDAGTGANYHHSMQVWFKASQAGILMGQFDTQVIGYIPSIYLGNDGKIYTSFFNHSGVKATVSAASTYNDNAWHQVVVTFGGGTESLYVDGALAGSTSSLSEDPYAAQSNPYIYRLGSGTWFGWPATSGWVGDFVGSLSELAFYDYTMSASEVAADYAARGVTVP